VVIFNSDPQGARGLADYSIQPQEQQLCIMLGLMLTVTPSPLQTILIKTYDTYFN
jgi:hypothetical protein